MEGSDQIWVFFHHRDPAADFPGFQEDQADPEGRGQEDLECQALAGRDFPEDRAGQGFPAGPEGFRGLREVRRAALKRLRPPRRNSSRRCRSVHLPLIPAGSDVACSATPMFG